MPEIERKIAPYTKNGKPVIANTTSSVVYANSIKISTPIKMSLFSGNTYYKPNGPKNIGGVGNYRAKGRRS